jgi:chromatin remodeling complex protein RSC6
VDFDDKSSWWYLFKDYWLNLKASLSLTVEEISGAKSKKGISFSVVRDNDLDELPDNNDEDANSESSLGRHLESNSLKKRGRKRSKQAITEHGFEGKERTKKSTKRSHSAVRDTQTSPGKNARKLSKRALSSQTKESESVGTSTSSAEEASWASEELLNFVAHMRNGDKSVLTQFDVQHLLLEYITRKNLRDPRRKSQIVCDSLLQSLFAKERVGHFEMLKLLESHFLMSEVSRVDADDNHGGVVDPDPNQDADGNSEVSVVMSSEKKRKSRKYDQKGHQPNLDEYAAIDNHNIGLMYLRRNIMEELISDVDSFDEKVVGSFVRIRIPGTGQRQDIYRLVQIVGKLIYQCVKRKKVRFTKLIWCVLAVLF